MIRALLAFPFNFTQIGIFCGLNRERVRQIALKFGHTGKERGLWHPCKSKLIEDGRRHCPRCKSKHVTKIGYVRSNHNQKYQCQDCRRCFVGVYRPNPRPIEYFQEISRLPRRRRSLLQYPYLIERGVVGNELLETIEAAIPKWLPNEVREEAGQDLAVAVLEGKVDCKELKGESRTYVSAAWNRICSKYSPLSLDSPIRSDDKNARTKKDFLVSSHTLPVELSEKLNEITGEQP